MRVVSGSARGVTLRSVPGDGTRPILDRVKTALFDILRPELSGYRVLDLFAGSGAVGIEALSQGAASCVFTDLNRAAVRTVKQNLQAAHLQDKAEVRQCDAFAFLNETNVVFDLIYVAPPQYKEVWIKALRAIEKCPHVLKTAGLVVVQIDPKEHQDLEIIGLSLEKSRTYGNTELIFYRKNN